LVDSSLPDEEDELELPEPLAVEAVEDSVLVEGAVEVVDDSVPVDVPDDSELLAFFAAAPDAAPFAAVALEVEVLATCAPEAVVLVLLESAGSCPEASCT